MGPRNLLILFFSTVAVSLVILVIFFSLFFKNVDLNFNTKMPESAPEIGARFGGDVSVNPDSKADGLMRSTVHVPPESHEPAMAAQRADEGPADADLPPVSDDAVLNDSPSDSKADLAAPVLDKSDRTDKAAPPAPVPAMPRAVERPMERRVTPPSPPPSSPTPMPEPAPDSIPSGPPVPGQG